MTHLLDAGTDPQIPEPRRLPRALYRPAGVAEEAGGVPERVEGV